MPFVSFIIGFIVLTLISLQSSFASSIGQVSLHEGNAVIDRKEGESKEVAKDLDVFSYDTVKTGNGKVGIEFIDQTRVDVTQHSKLVIDEFVYDPNTKTGKLSLKAKLGTVRYASGQIAKTSATNVKITTPTATIGVRGTDFTMTIDELGSSTIILLPSCNTNGNCFVGEISVESDAGQVILNQAFQATVVDTVASRPLKPITLELDEEMIGNLLIISKPAEIAEQQEAESLNEVADALDIDFLQFDDLEVDHLEEDESQFSTGLEIDFLEQNFLADILKQINKELAKAMRSEFDKRKTTGDITLGKDPETGVIILDEDPQWVWIREDASGSYIELRLDKEYGYVLNIVQGEFEQYDFELGGVDNAITIEQVN
tara:strand:- start:2030 stop:3148 length:1119 start_codon:yes stop_codon:yes gene_type:complete